jgi:hypothetical protein
MVAEKITRKNYVSYYPKRSAKNLIGKKLIFFYFRKVPKTFMVIRSSLGPDNNIIIKSDTL